MKHLEKIQDNEFGFDYGYAIANPAKKDCKYCGEDLVIPYFYCPTNELYICRHCEAKRTCKVTGNKEHIHFRIIEERK